MNSWSQTIVASLALGHTMAFLPSAQIPLRGVSLRVALETEKAVASIESKPESKESSAEAPLNSKLASSEPDSAYQDSSAVAKSPPKVSKFQPRPREAWAADGGYGRFADNAESEVYDLLKTSPLGKIDAALPFIEKTKARPPLLDGTHAGDCGFDPMNLCKTEELQYFYLESEVKHGRLAMVACAGWIGAELAKGDHLAQGGRAPSLLNGHLFDWQNLLPTLFLFGAWSYLEHQVYPAQYIEHTPNNGKHNYLHYMDGPYVAGNYDFDPFNLYDSLGDNALGRKGMRELEVQHGRAAMVGLTSWVLLEAATGAPIADLAGCFFKPFWQWGLPFLGENAFVGTLEFAALLGAAGYGAYSQVMEIDSMKYQGDGDPDFTMFD